MPSRMTLRALPLSAATKHKLLHDPGVAGAVLFHTTTADEDVRAATFGPGCASKTLDDTLARLSNASAYWERGQPTHEIAEQGRTAVAVHLLDETPWLTPYTAAKTAGINPSAVYRAMGRREAKAAQPTCQCCGRPLHATLGLAA